MDSSILNKMIQKKCLALSARRLLWHYSVPLLLLVAPVVVTTEVFKYYVTHTYTGKIGIGKLMFGYLSIAPAIGLYHIQKRRLWFKEINCVVDMKTFDKCVEETALKLKWKIEEKASVYVVAKSGFSWNSWGELITIIKDDNRILFNSICDSDNMISIASWGMNKKNRETFQESLEKNCA